MARESSCNRDTLMVVFGWSKLLNGIGDKGVGVLIAVRLAITLRVAYLPACIGPFTPNGSSTCFGPVGQSLLGNRLLAFRSFLITLSGGLVWVDDLLMTF